LSATSDVSAGRTPLSPTGVETALTAPVDAIHIDSLHALDVVRANFAAAHRRVATDTATFQARCDQLRTRLEDRP
jgi:hypothetical protein